MHELVYTDMSKYPNGRPPEKGNEDPGLQRLITRLNREIDELAEKAIKRADPEDLEGLRKFRAELIDRYPELARDLGIKK